MHFRPHIGRVATQYDYRPRVSGRVLDSGNYNDSNDLEIFVMGVVLFRNRRFLGRISINSNLLLKPQSP